MMSVGEPLAVSTWSEVELLSALGLKLRTNQLSEAAANDVVDSYARLVSPQLHHLPIEDAHHRHALTLLEGWRTSLRAADSLHLAIASAHGATIFTFDKGMSAASVVLGIPARLLA